MRNKIRLYIGTQQADLDDASFILLNYTQEELDNPTVVRNSFSKQITLKGTPRNDAIFGHIHRNDRVTQYNVGDEDGIDFDPTRKTTFTIYNDTQEVLETGYLKLDEIVTTRRNHSYKVTLYGGLGSFLYGLSYDANGDKLTLADLDYGETLDFTIDRDAVSDAWARLGGDTSKAAKWDILNFAPCYAGLPSGPFDAGKCIVRASLAGLNDTDGDYSSNDGWTLVTLAEKVTGNEAKDYRSYLQKPVISVKAMIDAICDPLNNGGWTVNQDATFFDAANPYWSKAWMTLPAFDDLNIDTSSSSGSVSFSVLPSTETLPGGGVLTTNYALSFSLEHRITFDTVLAYQHYKMHVEDDWAAGDPVDDSPGYYFNWLEYEVTAYDSSNNVIGSTVFRISTAESPEDAPPMDVVVDSIYVDWDSGANAFCGQFYKGGNPVDITFQISGYGIAKFKIEQRVQGISYGHTRAAAAKTYVWQDGYDDFNEYGEVNAYSLVTGVAAYDGTASSTVRTGASITKSALLGGSKTPADYLLSFCKTYGLRLVADLPSKTVDIVQRTAFFRNDVVDLTGRIDRGREIYKVPFAFDARWYGWKTEHKGEWSEYYRNKYGREYGAMRLNTGYEFDADEKAVTDGIVFSGLPTVLETSKYFFDLQTGGDYVPAVFVGGGTYRLYKGGGDIKEADLPNLTALGRTWLNPSNPMHDDWAKTQCHGTENAHLDERDTILFFDGMESPASGHVSLTDDTRMMMSLNGNNPCWLPNYCDYDAGWKVTSMPQFTRYVWSGSTVTDSVDWGTPLEAEIAGATFASGSDVFSQYWERYLGDRYDDDSAVVTAYVDLRGFQVGPDMLRSFYAFDGAIWSLNRIIDHSLTTGGPTKCEFVKVQDKNNYLNY